MSLTDCVLVLLVDIYSKEVEDHWAFSVPNPKRLKALLAVYLTVSNWRNSLSIQNLDAEMKALPAYRKFIVIA